MARYQGKTQPFLTPQMTTCHTTLQAAAGGVLSRTPAKFEKAMKTGNQSDKTFSHDTRKYERLVKTGIASNYWGGPRAYYAVGIRGPFVFALEFGSEYWQRTEQTKGSIRGAFGSKAFKVDRS